MQDPEVVKDRIALLDRLGLEGKVCAEIGVCSGTYSVEIHRRRPKRLYLIDPWYGKGRLPDKDEVRGGMGENGYLSVRLKFDKDPSVEIIKKTSFDASLDIPGQTLDFVFIDADHSYEYAFADLLLWYPKVKTGGWLAGHDYNRNEWNVREAVDSFVKVSGEMVSIITGEPAGRNPKICSGFWGNSFAIKRTR